MGFEFRLFLFLRCGKISWFTSEISEKLLGFFFPV